MPPNGDPAQDIVEKISVGYYSNVQKLAGRRTKKENNGDAHLVWAFTCLFLKVSCKYLERWTGIRPPSVSKGVLAGTLCLLAQRIQSSD